MVAHPEQGSHAVPGPYVGFFMVLGPSRGGGDETESGHAD